MFGQNFEKVVRLGLNMAKNKEEKSIKGPRALEEEKVLEFWKEKKIFQKTLEKPSPEGDFVFYEGPPTANGRPGIHHLEARAFKDVIPRYKTMQGFNVARKGGWDTHGLPVELEVQKRLDLKSKKDIEAFGIEKFNEECKKSVWTYVDEWKDFTARMGYWVDMENPYITYESKYIESVWNILSTVNDQKLLYKDYKVIPWCPRDGTALSSHEVAQGYKDVKDLSLTAKFKIVGVENGYFLAWTTTPWTLPGNVALAVGKEIDYVKIKIGEEILVLAKERLSTVSEPYEIVAEHKGSEMVGMEYEPLYPYLKDNLPEGEKAKLKNAFKVYSADFVTTTDGTGIVHTAVMYGQDDFELGTKHDLPKFHLVTETGHFVAGTGDFAGRFVRDEDVAVDVIKDLAHRGLLFKKEKYEHSYPHCWRCGTPLLYYARDSWYIRMSSLRDKLISENQKINWEPEYIRDGRFGEWLSDVKDWAISRERYWGTPLPIWTTEDKSEVLVINSIETLKKYTKKSGNKYFVMRHGGTESNQKEIVSYQDEASDHLTKEGRRGVLESAQKLKDLDIDLIVTSSFARTKETAQIVLETLVLPETSLITDKRLIEINPGEYDGKDWNLYHQHMTTLGPDWFTKGVAGGESLADVSRRVGELLYEIEQKHSNKKILFVTHGGPAWLLFVASGVFQPENQTYKAPDMKSVDAPIFVNGFARFLNAEIRELAFVPLPHNKNFELDLHKPFIDQVTIVSDSGKEMQRVKEVLDVWFDSGAMPFAQHHYPFENSKDLPYPADYICEGIDQTRGWFYTLHAIGILMGKGKAYKNVISLGLILDADGQKMSKSKGNVLNPQELMDSHGADALRYWMMSVNQPGESKNFDLRTVDDVIKKIFNLILNVVKFYELYSGERKSSERPESANVLDKWILAYLDKTVSHITSSLDSYKVLEASRMIRDFIADLSQWYVRRSRDRFKNVDDPEDKELAIQTLGFVLEQFSIVIAPFMPFLAEEMYQKLKTAHSAESVHLADWPAVYGESVSGVLSLTLMEEVRRLVSLGLEARARAGIKVRQPLSMLTLKSDRLKTHTDYLSVLMDEVNVKNVEFDDSITEEVLLETEISPELKREGEARELIRAIQEKRKEGGLTPDDSINIKLAVTNLGRAVVEEFRQDIEKVCLVNEIIFESLPEGSDPWFTVTL